MYLTIGILACFVLVYSAISGMVERSRVSGPIVFIATGVALGPRGLDVLHLDVSAHGLRTLAELTLALVLFNDAVNADLGVIRRNWTIPSRLLLIGLPLTIILGGFVAWVLLPSLALLEIALLTAILAPTDAALGAPVVSSRAVPTTIRESLNLESGLNDGICVPVVVILLGYAVGTQHHGDHLTHITIVAIEEIGLGLASGLALTVGAWALFKFTGYLRWSSANWKDLPVLALATTCFAAAQAIGGSGFIACFVGGLLAGPLLADRRHDRLRGAEGAGLVLALLTWVVFGAAVVTLMIDRFTWDAFAYGALSLTLIRMLPVYLCLHRTGLSRFDKLFIGWFGPRGLASIVFAIIVLDEHLPGNAVMMNTIAATVLLSVIAHGATANMMVSRLAANRPSAIPPDVPS